MFPLHGCFRSRLRLDEILKDILNSSSDEEVKQMAEKGILFFTSFQNEKFSVSI